MSSWEATEGKATYYISIQGDRVIIGNHFGSGHTDNAGVYTFQQVLNGEWDAHISRHFPGGVLAEVKAALRGAAKPQTRQSQSQSPSETEWEEFD